MTKIAHKKVAFTTETPLTKIYNYIRAQRIKIEHGIFFNVFNAYIETYIYENGAYEFCVTVSVRSLFYWTSFQFGNVIKV